MVLVFWPLLLGENVSSVGTPSVASSLRLVRWRRSCAWRRHLTVNGVGCQACLPCLFKVHAKVSRLSVCGAAVLQPSSPEEAPDNACVVVFF